MLSVDQSKKYQMTFKKKRDLQLAVSLNMVHLTF